MQYALFAKPVVTVYDLPAPETPCEDGMHSTIGDEGLYGQVCRIQTPPGGTTAEGQALPADVAEVYTFYGYHGYVFRADILPLGVAELAPYLAADLVLTGRATDVLSLPRVAGVRLLELERGAVLRRAPEAAPTPGWAKVLLADGRAGFVRDVALGPVRYPMDAVRTLGQGLAFNDALAKALGCAPEALVSNALARWHGGSEAAFRDAVAETALSYLGVEYRWGGKSGRGVDCSGLVSSAYLQNGVLIYRDARLVEGWPMHAIPFEQKQRGDALFFPGHIALYLGEGRYVHSTGAAASGGVVVNSLDPADPLYRADLVQSLYAVGSIF